MVFAIICLAERNYLSPRDAGLGEHDPCGQTVRGHVVVKCRSSASRENCAGDPGEEREVRASKALPTHLSPNNHEALASIAVLKLQTQATKKPACLYYVSCVPASLE